MAKIEFVTSKARWESDQGGDWVAFKTTDLTVAAQLVNTFREGGEYRVSVVRPTKKRSLDANAYCWVLIGKMADALTKEAHGLVAYSKDDVYLMMLKKYGQGGVAKIKNSDVPAFQKAWKYSEPHEKLWDKAATYMRFWVGSSNYDTHEMAVFIDGIIAECHNMGIETITPDEKAKLVSLWGGDANG